MREKPSCVTIIEYNEQVNILEVINWLVWFFEIKKEPLWKRPKESLMLWTLKHTPLHLS